MYFRQKKGYAKTTFRFWDFDTWAFGTRKWKLHCSVCIGPLSAPTCQPPLVFILDVGFGWWPFLFSKTAECRSRTRLENILEVAAAKSVSFLWNVFLSDTILNSEVIIFYSLSAIFGEDIFMKNPSTDTLVDRSTCRSAVFDSCFSTT